jgi:hypothetical protein
MKDKDQVDTVGAVIASDSNAPRRLPDHFIITENEVRNYGACKTINNLSLKLGGGGGAP